jgi:DNA topoisomerase IA
VIVGGAAAAGADALALAEAGALTLARAPARDGGLGAVAARAAADEREVDARERLRIDQQGDRDVGLGGGAATVLDGRADIVVVAEVDDAGAGGDPLADAARARSEADWLVGMNATRAITARGRASGRDALYSIGRVQTPTLAMLVQREQAIAAFVPRDYWEVRGELVAGDGARFAARWRHGATGRLGSEALAAAIVARDQAHARAADPVGPRVERVRARTVREPPPLLFDLTSLQRTANKRFGWSAARTLELAQALYERHKLLTYPRTDSRHLTSDVVAELPALFGALGQRVEYAPFVAPLLASPPRPGRRIVDDGKVHDHHAIIPTGKVAGVDALDRDLRRLFDLVVRRFLGAFHPDAEIAQTEVWIRVGPGPAAREAPASGARTTRASGRARRQARTRRRKR